MREEFPRIGGDAAVEALAMASQRVPNSLAMSLAERTRRRIGQEAFWSSPSENVRDRATAMLPRPCTSGSWSTSKPRRSSPARSETEERAGVGSR
jgi:hypothetical protein